MRAALLIFLSGCGAAPAFSMDAGVDAGPDDAGVDGGKAAGCASAFGSGLTTSFGRFDGVVSAVVTPADTQCALPNSDHVVVQVKTDAGVYRMVVNVKSDFGDPDVRFATLDAPLLGGAWSEGWHPGASLDYPSMLGLHADAGFAAFAMPALIQRVADELTVGQRISVFADSSGGTYSDSAHKIHRNGGSRDGALVINPEAPSAHWLIFHFANQTF
jgi:hypothetical protein